MLQNDAGEGNQHEDDPTVLLVQGCAYDRKRANYSRGVTIMDILVQEFAW